MNPKKLIALVVVKVVVLGAIVGGVVLNMGGCNTVRGVGQDIEKGGEAIQKAVK
ncbi:MAG: entericidin A/B family lipoprotein [Sulfuricella sp.]|nr:entericidin A/B family lipoprotein [Sulfuricella sp.]